MSKISQVVATPSGSFDVMVTFDVDHALFDKYAADVKGFWASSSALEDEYGVVGSAIRKVARQLLLAAADGCLTPEGLQRIFDDESMEGFCRAEEMGITVVSSHAPDFDCDALDIEISEKGGES